MNIKRTFALPKMRLRKPSRRAVLIAGGITLGAAFLFYGAYAATASLVENVVEQTVKRAGFATAKVSQPHIYLDGIVFNEIILNDQIKLQDVFIPQSAPNIGKVGIQRMIIRHWDQTFPALQSLTVEDIKLHMALPLQKITLSGTLKSLRPDDKRLALTMQFSQKEKNLSLEGNIEILVENGQLSSADVNIEDGFFESKDVSLKRVSGWFNAQFSRQQEPQIKAQYMAGSALYNGQVYPDGMVQYSRSSTEPTQWTVTLNRAANDYFNSWTIKPARDGRYAIQAASQNGPQTRSSVMVSAAPLVLEPLIEERQAR
jgi:hypothetical protein